MSKAVGQVLRIDRICRNVPDLEAAVAFYCDALGCVQTGTSSWLEPAETALLGAPRARVARALLRLGQQKIELLGFEPKGRPYPDDSTASDLWFQHCAIVVADMATAFAHLHSFAIRPISLDGPEMLPPATGSVTAFKFRDPFGHPLELLSFPYRPGGTVWQASPSRELFLGIDHTAIAVADAERSRAFYVERLRFRAGPWSKNSGEAQSRLDAITADQVDVVALSPNDEPPHLELLGYRAGRRRPQPQDPRPDDGAITRIIMTVSGGFPPLMDVETATRVGTWGGRAAIAFADPDGHELIVRQA